MIQANSRSYAVCRRLLNLDVYEMSEVDPDDINYVYGIYAPLSVRLIQHISKSDSKILSDVLPLLPGPIVEHVNSDVDQGNLFIYYYLDRPYSNYSRYQTRGLPDHGMYQIIARPYYQVHCTTVPQ